MRISGVYVHTGTRHSKQLVLTEEQFTDGVVNNNFIIKLMQYKDTFQQAFLIIYFHAFFLMHERHFLSLIHV